MIVLTSLILLIRVEVSSIIILVLHALLMMKIKYWQGQFGSGSGTSSKSVFKASMFHADNSRKTFKIIHMIYGTVTPEYGVI